MMMQKDNESLIVVCSCTSPKRMRNRVEIGKLISALQNAGYTVTPVSDLCKTALSDTEQMAAFASSTVIACYPRAIQSIFGRLGLNTQRVYDIHSHSAEEILEEMGIIHPFAEQDRSLSRFMPVLSFSDETPDGERPAWYPVIDKTRCTDCGKCHDFCLFGVYSVSEGRASVSHPRNCKDQCPACARVCPSKAIIFPKYDKSPVNGGLHDEEPSAGLDKASYHAALRYRLEERRAKISLLKNNGL